MIYLMLVGYLTGIMCILVLPAAVERRVDHRARRLIGEAKRDA